MLDCFTNNLNAPYDRALQDFITNKIVFRYPRNMRLKKRDVVKSASVTVRRFPDGGPCSHQRGFRDGKVACVVSGRLTQ